MKTINLNKLFNHNIFVRLLAFVLAVIVWGSITLLTNPDQTRVISDISVNIPVGDFGMAGSGLEVVSGGGKTVSVLVDGKRYKVGNLTNNDIAVTADVSKVKKPGLYELKLSAVQKKEDKDYKIKSVTPSSIKVRVDYVVSATIALEAKVPNVTAKENYIKDNPYPSSETIEITGAKSDVEKVKSAVLISDKKATISNTLVIEDGKVELYDASGNKVDQSSITYSPQNLQITVPILKQKDLNLTFSFKNVPNNFPIDELKYTLSRTTLKVMASNEALANIKELNLGYIDLRTVDIGSVYTLDIGLPSGFVNLEDDKKVKVMFDKEGLSSKTFTVSNFELLNQPKDYNVSVSTKSLSKVKIVGKKSIIDSLKKKDIKATIDLMQDTQITQAGKITAPVTITVPGKGLVWAVGEYNVILNAQKK